MATAHAQFLREMVDVIVDGPDADTQPHGNLLRVSIQSQCVQHLRFRGSDHEFGAHERDPGILVEIVTVEQGEPGGAQAL